jgi:hypothetical protein
VTTWLRELIHSPLSADDASALVDEVTGLVEELVEADDAPERDDDGYAAVDVLDDVSLEVDASPPPAAVLALLPRCRSTIALEYAAHVFDKAPFVALQKLLFERVGDAVVSSGEGAGLTTLEALVARRAREVGPTWAKTPPLGRPEPPKKAPKTRAARPGELDALAVHKRLARIIEGRDPLERDMLRRELERTTERVRAYAAALMEEGPTPDTAIAKELGWTLTDVVASREELGALLARIR